MLQQCAVIVCFLISPGIPANIKMLYNDSDTTVSFAFVRVVLCCVSTFQLIFIVCLIVVL